MRQWFTACGYDGNDNFVAHVEFDDDNTDLTSMEELLTEKMGKTEPITVDFAFAGKLEELSETYEVKVFPL